MMGGGAIFLYIRQLQTLYRKPLPVFASLSSFLFRDFYFFYKTNFSFSSYLSKLKKRAKTILVPYLFWNAMVIGFFFFAQTFFASLLSGENKMIIDYSIKDWLEAFWARPYPTDHPNYRPIAFQFWFMRDLMVTMVFSPVIYILVKYLRSFGVCIMGVLWLFGFGFNVPGFSIVCFFSFSTGAYFSVHKKNFATCFSSVLSYSSVIYLIIALVDLCTKGSVYNQYIHVVGIITGCIFLLDLWQRVSTKAYGK